jgi:hypothetical protein
MLLSHNPNIEYDLKKYYPDIYRKFSEIRNKNMYNTFRANLIKGVKEGFYRADLNIDILSWWHVKRTEHLQSQIQRIPEEKGFSQLDLLTEMIKYHFYAIASEKGIKEFNKLQENEEKSI